MDNWSICMNVWVYICVFLSVCVYTLWWVHVRFYSIGHGKRNQTLNRSLFSVHFHHLNEFVTHWRIWCVCIFTAVRKSQMCRNTSAIFDFFIILFLLFHYSPFHSFFCSPYDTITEKKGILYICWWVILFDSISTIQ